MQVILTPTAVADMFGAGLNGFKGSIPPLPPPTELSAEWFNSMQMEVVNVILGQGIALDGLLFDQLKTAIDDYSFGSPSLTGSMTVESGALITFLNGSASYWDVGSTFYVFSDDAQFYGDLTIGTASSDVLGINSTATFSSPAIFNGNVDIGNNIADTCTITSLIDAKVTIGATDNAAYLLNVSNIGTGGGVVVLVAGGYAGWFETDTTSATKAATTPVSSRSSPRASL